MQEIWGMWSTPSLPLLLDPLWLGVVVLDRVLSMGQTDLKCVLILNWIAWNRIVSTFKLRRLTKAWTAINRLSIIWKSDLTDKMKRSFFQAAVTSILLYGCTTWTLTKRLEKKLDGNYTRMLRAILNKSWQQHPTRHQLYGHLPPITKTIQVRRTRHAGHCWRSRDELIRDVTLMDPHTWPRKSRATSSNVHSAAMWGYRLLSWRPT